MQVRLLLITLSCLFPFVGWSQKEGCTDPKAKNYDPEAIVNDGSCVYRHTVYRPQVVIAHLPDSVIETSGLIFWNDSYWTHNDSEGSAAIFRLDTLTGSLMQRVAVKNATNIDWEDITHDDSYIYIGDIGNNLGSRQDQVIYMLPKNGIPDTGNVVIDPQKITYRFGDQTDYSIMNRANDFDCEALLSFGDSLYLFTKNWVTLTCRLYAIPKVPGHYVIFPIDEFNADGLITGAAMDLTTKQLVLCGYKNYVPFVWLLDNFWRNDFFGGNKRRIDFWELAGAQTEGITSIDRDVFMISAEKTLVNDAKLFRLDLKEID